MGKFSKTSIVKISLVGALLTTACTKQHYIQPEENNLALFYSDPFAKQVLFVSSLDNFQQHPASRYNGRIWKVLVAQKNEFEYFYIVDGVITTPECKNTVLDDFGAKNCLYVRPM